MGFFDDYPEFLETSNTGAFANRLNKRHRAIFGARPEIFRGARVLDIASHDGRWSLAALRSGATHVVGVEPREHLVRHAVDTLSRLDIPDGTFRFVQDDVFSYLGNSGDAFDVILCLGFLYHTYRHPELLSLIKRKEPKYLIVDSVVHPSDEMVCCVTTNRTEKEAHAYAESSTYKDKTFVAIPSIPLLVAMLSHFDFNVRRVDWSTLVGDDLTGIADYAEGRRATFICEAA